ncbi:MAG: PQQ-dependent sugar dehydrogenase [Dehalococcoidia bacterium]|nr:PQQ-dependent sugar dehydrogenase [Dehalococcoidia bacterium]
MNRKVPASVLVFALLILVLAACGGGGAEKLPFGLQSEVVASGLRAPRALTFAPDGRLFFAEQFSGVIHVINADGRLQPEPFAQIQVASYLDLDWGLTGIALDPEFTSNHYVYVLYTSPLESSEQPVGKPTLLRFTDQGGQGVDKAVISDNFPETPVTHPGYNGNGNLHFGPDGFLYLSIGDYDEGTLVRDLSTPIGKLLRVSKEDGSAAPGNPYADDPNADPRIFAVGFREPFAFAFQPETGAIYGTDNTPVTCEELNVIEAGKNYGWPDVGAFPFSDCDAGDHVKAIHRFAQQGKSPGEFLSFVEVSGVAFLSSKKYPLLSDGLLVCELGSGVLRRLVLGGAPEDPVSGDDVLVKDCKRGVAVSPDGTVYYSNNAEIRRLTSGQIVPQVSS